MVTPRKPPLPPASKENLSASKSTNNIEPLAASQPIVTNIIRPVPTIFEQRKVTTPVHFAQQPTTLIVNSNRPGSSHGVQVVQMDRPGSSHGVVKTVLPTNQNIGQIVPPQHHTTTFIQHPGHVHTQPIMTTTHPTTHPIHPQTVTFNHGPII